jgi:hypothetical protein
MATLPARHPTGGLPPAALRSNDAPQRTVAPEKDPPGMKKSASSEDPEPPAWSGNIPASIRNPSIREGALSPQGGGNPSPRVGIVPAEHPGASPRILTASSVRTFARRATTAMMG